MIVVHQTRVAEVPRSRSQGSLWKAETVIDGVTYTVQSRHGAPNELARVLVAAGIADDVMRVTHEGLRGHMEWRSMHTAATRSFSEGSGTLRNVKYTNPSESTET